MRFALVTAAAFILAVTAACGTSDGTNHDGRPQGSARGANSLVSNDIVSTGFGGLVSDTGENLQQTITSDGVTVAGYGTATAQPSGASVQLTISAGDPFSSGSYPGFNISFIEVTELEPIVEALKATGVQGDSIDVNSFAQDSFGTGQGAATITFDWSETDGVTQLAEDLADIVSDETKYTLSGFQVLFTVDDCESLEEQAQETALADARKRAERLASLAGLPLGDIRGIAEGGGVLALYGVPQGCASIDELNPLLSGSLNPHNSPDEVRIDYTLTVTFAVE